MSDVVFSDGTLWAKSKLGMINECLLAIGETPFPEGTLISDLPLGTDGDTARRIVETTMVEVQNRGWYFNTDYDFKLLPDDEGFVTLPPNVLRVDVGNTVNRHRFILKNNRLYDIFNHTYKIDEVVYSDIIWLVDYADLPPAAYEYIALRAARKFQQNVIGSQELHPFTALAEEDARVNMQREHLQYQDYNLLSPRVSNRLSNNWLRRGLYNNKTRR